MVNAGNDLLVLCCSDGSDGERVPGCLVFSLTYLPWAMINLRNAVGENLPYPRKRQHE